MLKRFAVASLLIVIFVVSIVAYLYVQKTQSDLQKAASVSDFELIVRYGVGARNELNTFNGTYTHDMIIDPPITTNLTLTIEEKWPTLQRIEEMDFFNLPSSFPVNPHMWVTPQVDYYIKVQNGSQTKEVSWNDNSLVESSIENSLDQLVIHIRGVIEQKLEYKALPTPNGGYL